MFGAIGDALLASSIAHDLRRVYPRVRLVAFASAANHGIFDLLEGLDEIVITPVKRPFRAIAELRSRTLDILIDAGQWPRISAVLAALSKAKFTIGFETTGQCRHWAYDAVCVHSPHRHELENFRSLLGCLGIRATGTPVFKRKLILEASSGTAERFIVLHPWASGYRSQLREWPTCNWVQLGVVALNYGYALVITGGPQDVERAESLAAVLGGGERVLVIAGRASLWQTAVRLLNAAAVVSVNTGIMHMAALLDRPTVALHGPTDPRRWGPVGPSSVIVGPAADAGCGYLNLGFEYPKRPPDCMSMISVGEVVSHLGRMLGWAASPQDDIASTARNAS